MKHSHIAALALAGAFASACGGGSSNFPTNKCADVTSGTCIEIKGGDVAALQDAANSASSDTTLILGEGTFTMTNALTIRNASGISIIGQGIEQTILDFGPVEAQVNGIDVVGDDFLVQDLTVLDAPKDGIRVEDSDGVVFRRIRATWTNESDVTNGAYGIYPVKSRNVLVEESRAENASDAGLYVGQCQNVIVRNNEVRGNVAGLEIENTQYADVYDNHAEDNTTGIVVFDLPGNPIVGRDVRLRNNTIINNNRLNFAVPGTTVAAIPAGTGTFAMASRRVEITDNTYQNNQTVDIAIISGLVVESEDDGAAWALQTSSLVGDWEDLDLISPVEGVVMNFRTENIVVARNSHDGSGLSPDASDPMMLGVLLSLGYGTMMGGQVDSVLYDTIGEPMFDAEDPAMNSNVNNICVGANTDGTFGSMNLAEQGGIPPEPFLSLSTAPFAPFDCTELSAEVGGPVQPVTLP